MVHFTKHSVNISHYYSLKILHIFKTNWLLEWISINPPPFYHKPPLHYPNMCPGIGIYRRNPCIEPDLFPSFGRNQSLWILILIPWTRSVASMPLFPHLASLTIVMAWYRPHITFSIPYQECPNRLCSYAFPSPNILKEYLSHFLCSNWNN